MSVRSAIAGLVSFAALACLSSPSHAQINLGRRGFFVGAGGVFASEQFSGDRDWDNTAGFVIEGGYRFRSHWSVDLELDWLDDFELSGGDATVELRTAIARVKWLVYTGRFQPYLTAGPGTTTARIGNAESELSKTTDLVGHIGGGVEYYTSSEFVLAFEIGYRFASGGVEGLDTSRFKATLQYRF